MSYYGPIFLGLVSGSYSTDDLYFLGKDKNGNWQVEVETSQHDSLKTAKWSVLPPAQWDTIMIRGQSLVDVIEKAKAATAQ